MTSEEIRVILENHKKWLNCEEGGEKANLSRADLSGANLRWANLDFSCLHFSCNSLSAHFDDKQLRQIAYHLCKAGLASKNASPEAKSELAKITGFANGFHRVDECGEIIVEEANNLNENEPEEDS